MLRAAGEPVSPPSALAVRLPSYTCSVSPRLRAATLADLPAIAPLEAEAFDGAHSTLEHELRHNGAARYILLETDDSGPAIAGLAGLWLQFDEAHVVTVAVEPALRGCGYGRLLVHGLVVIAAANGMDDLTLEVRASNIVARALYRTYGFHEIGERKRYYADNGEDAIIMTTESLGSERFRARLAALEAELVARFGGSATDSLYQCRLDSTLT